jgi:hypothetical protein
MPAGPLVRSGQAVRACGQELQLSTLRPRSRAAVGGRRVGDGEEILAGGGSMCPALPARRATCGVRVAGTGAAVWDSRDPAHPDSPGRPPRRPGPLQRRGVPAAASRRREPAVVTCLARRGEESRYARHTTHVLLPRPVGGGGAHRSWI